MKKVVMILSCVVLVSCESNLPSNINSAVTSVELQADMCKYSDSLITALDKQTIDKLSLDSLRSIVMDQELRDKWYYDSEKELDELLKYNPKYSDHSVIKNMKIRYRTEYTLKNGSTMKDPNIYFTNLNYINERITDLILKH